MCSEHERQAAADDGGLPRLDASCDAFEMHCGIAVAKQLCIKMLSDLRPDAAARKRPVVNVSPGC